MPTFYDELEVSPNASPETIRAAYRSLIQRYHPDRNQGSRESALRTLRLNEAYAVLSDPVKRASYDAKLAAGQRARSEREEAHRQAADEAATRAEDAVAGGDGPQQATRERYESPKPRSKRSRFMRGLRTAA